MPLLRLCETDAPPIVHFLASCFQNVKKGVVRRTRDGSPRNRCTMAKLPVTFITQHLVHLL